MIYKLKKIVKFISEKIEATIENIRLKPQKIIRFRTPSSRRLMIVAHYDPDQVFDQNFLYFLTNLSQDLDVAVTVVSTCENLSQEQIEKLNGYADCLIIRRNYGRDFASWKLGIELSENYDFLILTNDTLYGPLTSIRSFADKIEKKELPVLGGLTDNNEIEHHLQSYFLIFNSAAIKSDWFQKYWAEFRAYQVRQKTIENGEIGLSQSARRSGIEMISCFEYKEIIKFLEDKSWRSIQKNLNPYHFFWRELIEKMNYPFLKVELLKLNPNQIPDLADYKKIVSDMGYPAELIENHLLRMQASGKSQ
jgi:lipopolysaccharide biosynthesis protein